MHFSCNKYSDFFRYMDITESWFPESFQYTCFLAGVDSPANSHYI